MEHNLLILLGFILGVSLGSFIKVLSDRSLGKNSFLGRSYCQYCNHKLAWYDLFPILSYIYLKGRCRTCRKKIAPEYLLVEVLMGLLVGLLFSQTIPSNFLNLGLVPQSLLVLDLAFKTFAVCVFIAVLLTDLKKGLIPDRITYPAVLIAFVYLIISSIYKIALVYLSLLNSVVGKYLLPPHSDYFFRHALIAADPLTLGILSAFGLAIFFGSIIFLTKGRGMGGGDLKLGIFMGFILGFPNSLIALSLAFLTGSTVGIGLLILKKRHFGQTIPFGPFLSLGSITALLWGEKIASWYFNLRI